MHHLNYVCDFVAYHNINLIDYNQATEALIDNEVDLPDQGSECLPACSMNPVRP